jgi:hypothetical protein
MLTLGRAALGQFASQITAFEVVVGYSRCHFASFADNKCMGKEGGARLSASACRIVVGMIKENIMNGGVDLPIQWPDLSSEYEKEKEKYAPDKSQWRLTDTILNRVNVQKRRGEAGRSVGIYGKDRVRKISFDVMHEWPATKTIYPSQYAFWNEFGTNSTKYSGGQPPRPVFIPTYQQFARKYLPKLADSICKSLEEDFDRLATNLSKAGGMFIGEKAAGPKDYLRGMHAGELTLDKDDFSKISNEITQSVEKLGGGEGDFGIGEDWRAELAKQNAKAKQIATACRKKMEAEAKRAGTILGSMGIKP